MNEAVFPPVVFSKADDPLVQVLAGREFGELVTIARLVEKGAFIVALYNTPTARQALVTQLRRRLAPLPLYEFTVTAKEPNVMAYLRQIPSAEREKRAVISIYDLEAGWPDAARWLDRQRDQLAAYPHTLIFWIQAMLWLKLMEVAPNFYSRHSGVFDLRLVGNKPPDQSQLASSPRSLLTPLDNLGAANTLEGWEERRALYAALLAEHEADPQADDRAKVDLHRRLGQLYRARSYFLQAREHFQKALALLPTDFAAEDEADLWYEIGRARYYADEHDAALEACQQALKLYREVGARLGEANVLLSLGDLEREQKHLEAAGDYYQQAKQLYEAIGDRYSLARVLYRQGDWYMARQESEAAIGLYDQAIVLWQAIGMDDLVSQILLPRRQQAMENGAG